MTSISFEAGGATWRADLTQSRDISIPMRFDEAQPNAYDVEMASAEAYAAGEVIGDVRRGGSCNFDRVTLIPHCNGTHTECVGHLTRERIAITDVFAGALVPATLISVSPVPALETGESYLLVKEDADRVITAAAIESALASALPACTRALIIRTLPNDEGKRRRAYMRDPAPFFTVEAMHAIVAHGVQHLLVDVPSLDRAFDEGRLSAHRVYWNLAADAREVAVPPSADTQASALRTITEMVYVGNDIADGAWLLSLQIAPFVLDAAPSRPVLHPLTRIAPHP